MTEDEAHMDHALRLAARGLGNVWPNPAVGCVIVREGRVVGRGWTQPGGRPHAEARALAEAGGAARGATAYVTLEPCAHHGKTPPCAEALAAAGVARVVSALTDPDPRVCGAGHARLRQSGISVAEGVRMAEAQRINAGFFKRLMRGLPFVTLKLATTLDGRIATVSGESRWITGAEARRRVHAMRMAHDVVMVGSGTAMADDPDLGVRDLGAAHQPVRVVVDSGLRHKVGSRLGQLAGSAPVWIFHGQGADASSWQATGARLFPLPLQEGYLDLKAALSALAREGITRVFCEGGAGLGAALVRAGLVDDLVLFGAGKLIGQEGRAALGPLALPSLELAPRLRLKEFRRIGEDTMSVWGFE